QYASMIKGWQEKVETMPASELVQEVIEDSGYVRALKDKGTDEDLDRIQNVQELYNAVIQFEEENEDATLLTFLGSAALNSDMDDDNQRNAVSLMTLHSSKGLEFPVVFVVGMEQGLFPSFRSLDDAAAIEEERRLCYVGITRAQ
ncbi:MAG: 3'-5' exonuclease, partial [Bacteroidota bacterium]